MIYENNNYLVVIFRMRISMNMQKRTLPFRIAVDYFCTLLRKRFSSHIFRIKRFCFTKIFTQTGSEPHWDHHAKKHENTPETDQEHDDEKHKP